MEEKADQPKEKSDQPKEKGDEPKKKAPTTTAKNPPLPKEAEVAIEPTIFKKKSAANLGDRDRLFKDLQKVLQDHPTAKFEFVGHGDDTDFSATNYDISLNRARFLAANMSYRGIPKEIISFKAVGDKEPSPKGNCRVEIIVNIK